MADASWDWSWDGSSTGSGASGWYEDITWTEGYSTEDDFPISSGFATNDISEWEGHAKDEAMAFAAAEGLPHGALYSAKVAPAFNGSDSWFCIRRMDQ